MQVVSPADQSIRTCRTLIFEVSRAAILQVACWTSFFVLLPNLGSSLFTFSKNLPKKANTARLSISMASRVAAKHQLLVFGFVLATATYGQQLGGK